MKDTNEQIMTCDHCGREVFANGEDSFACPYCGATVETGSRRDESPAARLARLEREIERANVRADIEKEASDDMFWNNPLGLMAGLDRQRARQALECGDVDDAKRHLESAKRTSSVGCIVNIVYIVIVVVIIIISSLR